MLHFEVGWAKGKFRMEVQRCALTAAHNIDRSLDSWVIIISCYCSSATSITDICVNVCTNKTMSLLAVFPT